MLRKTSNGNIEVFYVDNLETKQLLDTERKKERFLKSMVITEVNKKNDLRLRQKMASDLRKIKIAKKEVLS
ncbi:hypothetical protein KQI46_20065 [Lysinibacillus capsici]|uniref:hypothetical protein n=1 Tax=Lysinibacillus capsici TaxID=2115968 RepID=UPI001C0F75EB|nr:hypothetical protein [Lysinibacillus capsici]MBU5254191.1 hypothetical protein [Lysinibacillus capsici]